MLDLIKRSLERLPAGFGEIRIEKKLLSLIELSNAKIETISKKEVRNASVRLLKNGQWGFISFTDVDDLDRYIRTVLENTSRISPYSRIKREVVSHPKVNGHFRTQFTLDPFSRSLEEKHALLTGYDGILQGFKKLINRKLTYVERKEESYYGNTEGSLVSQEKVFTGLSVNAVARDGNNIQMSPDSWGGYSGYEIVQGHEQEMEHIGRTAEDLLKARMLDGGHYEEVLDP
ncbi:MAG: DNA gyrase modulator, partial [bacterium]|nr:DNA gyrase modulator [bacterium]